MEAVTGYGLSGATSAGASTDRRTGKTSVAASSPSTSALRVFESARQRSGAMAARRFFKASCSRRQAQRTNSLCWPSHAASATSSSGNGLERPNQSPPSASPLGDLSRTTSVKWAIHSAPSFSAVGKSAAIRYRTAPSETRPCANSTARENHSANGEFASTSARPDAAIKVGCPSTSGFQRKACS